MNKKDNLHILSTNNLIAKSISFTPEFINVNLNYDTILAENYLDLCIKHHYPSFDLFYCRNIIYNGIMPLDIDIFKILPGFIEEIIKQVKDQPDKKWSCRARANVIALIEKVSFFNKEMLNDNTDVKPLVRNALIIFSLIFTVS